MNDVLKLNRPLAVLDLRLLEQRQRQGRIIEIAILLVYPYGKEIEYSRRVNPEMAIPCEATMFMVSGTMTLRTSPPFGPLL